MKLGKYDVRPALLTLKGKKGLIGCEVGVEYGKNAQWMLENLDIRFLYLIDPWCNYDGLKYDGVFASNDEGEKAYIETCERLKSYSNKIMIIRDFPENVVSLITSKLDFVYEDSSHRYEHVLHHLNLFFPLIKKGGLVAGHDYKHDYENTVCKAVKEFFGESGFSQEEWDFWQIKGA